MFVVKTQIRNQQFVFNGTNHM